MKKFELRRQTFHLVLGTSMSVALYLLYPIYGRLVLVPLLLAIVFMLAFPYIPLNLQTSNRLILYFEREHDKKVFPFKGAITFGMGVILPILLLPADPLTNEPLLACAVMTTLAAGDSVSTMIGKFHGKIRVGHKRLKSVEGFLAFIGGATFLTTVAGFADLATALTFGIVGGLVELYDPLDDNIGIPVGLTIFYLLVDIIAPNTIF